MSDGTRIEWTHIPGTKGVTLNPIRARNIRTGKRGWYCEHVSEACRFCYAERLNMKAGDTGGTGLPYKPSMRQFADIYLDEKTLLQPLHWREPRTIFWCSMTDVFAEWVPDEWIDKIFAVAALTPQHTHIFLTKRPERMQARTTNLMAPEHRLRMVGFINGLDRGYGCREWPLPNVWLGVTAEDQPNADERIPLLLQTPAAVRFVSCEPMLGAIDLMNLCAFDDRTHGWSAIWRDNPLRPWINWVICGGETGKNARAMYLDWPRSLRDQCKSAGVPFFFKQWGEFLPMRQMYWLDHPEIPQNGLTEEDLNSSYHVGKHRAGRLLDGVEHNEWPERLR